MKGYSIEYKLVTSNYGIEYKVVTSFILHLEYKWSIVLQSRHTRGGGINIIYSLASIMVYHMGAYNSKRHATTGFSPYMLTRGVEKAIPLTFLYPEFAAKSFETHEAYVDHVLARQQEIHDLVRRNTHQAQLRQKLKYDRARQARAYQPGELVWVFCRYVPQKGSPKLMRAWRGPHKIVQVFQDGRVYVLDTGQKVNFERLKPHHSGPLELAAAHANSGEVVVLMDPEPERSVDVVDDDKSLPSYKSEQLLSEASDVSGGSLCIISNSTILLGVLMTNYLMSSCRYLRIPLMRIKWSLRLLRLLQINRFHPLVLYLNYSLTMSACAHRLHKYLPLIKNHRCRERRHPY